MSYSQRYSYKPAGPSRYSRSSNFDDHDHHYQHRSSSRGYDHSHSSRSYHNKYDNQRYPSQKSGTFGTYIWPLDESRRYVTDDPTKCRCNCCPHPTSICKSREEPHNTDPYSSRASSYDPPRKTSQPSQTSRHSRSHRSSKRDGFVIDVVDNTDSALNRKHGSTYPITLPTSASVSSIVSFLAPDRRRAKVVVHWTDGEVETLDEQVPLKELKKYAKYLEVRKLKKKRVHWA